MVARACVGLARLAEARKDMPEAVSQYARALQIDPTLSDARQALSQALQGMSGGIPGAPSPR
jgi:cytochrome c-type biogenesis protein CcmH/NrfG